MSWDDEPAMPALEPVVEVEEESRVQLRHDMSLSGCSVAMSRREEGRSDFVSGVIPFVLPNCQAELLALVMDQTYMERLEVGVTESGVVHAWAFWRQDGRMYKHVRGVFNSEPEWWFFRPRALSRIRYCGDSVTYEDEYNVFHRLYATGCVLESWLRLIGRSWDEMEGVDVSYSVIEVSDLWSLKPYEEEQNRIAVTARETRDLSYGYLSAQARENEDVRLAIGLIFHYRQRQHYSQTRSGFEVTHYEWYVGGSANSMQYGFAPGASSYALVVFKRFVEDFFPNDIAGVIVRHAVMQMWALRPAWNTVHTSIKFPPVSSYSSLLGDSDLQLVVNYRDETGRWTYRAQGGRDMGGTHVLISRYKLWRASTRYGSDVRSYPMVRIADAKGPYAYFLSEVCERSFAYVETVHDHAPLVFRLHSGESGNQAWKWTDWGWVKGDSDEDELWSAQGQHNYYFDHVSAPQNVRAVHWG